MAAAACSRANLQRVFVTKKEASKLAEVEKALLATASDDRQQPAPSVLRGCVVRLKYAGAYCLLPVEGLAAAADGRAGLEVLFPDPEQRDKLFLRVPLTSASSSNPLDDVASWEAAGRAEAERLAALLLLRGQPLTVAEVAAAAWRKQAALQWHAQHGRQPADVHVTALLQQLQNQQAIAELEQEVELDEQQQQAQQPQQAVGFTVQLPGQPGGQQHQAVQPPPQQQQQQQQLQAAQPPPQQQQQVASGAAMAALPASGTDAAAAAAAVAAAAAAAAGPPAAAGPGNFLAGLELQLADAAARSAADGSSAGTLAVVAEIQAQLAALKQQILAVQQQAQPQAQPQQPMAPAQPAWHASSSSGGDHLSPYLGPAMRGAHRQPSSPLPASWQAQQQAGFHPGRLPSRSPSPRRQQRHDVHEEPPLVPAAVRHFKHGNFVQWELVGQQLFVSGLPTCDGERVQRPVVAHRLAKLVEGTGAAVSEVKIHKGDNRGDIAYVTLATARQAAHAIDVLQGAELMDGRRMFLRPFRNEVDTLKQRFPEAAAEAARALERMAANRPQFGHGQPPVHGHSFSPLPMRGRSFSPPVHRDSPGPRLDRGRSLPPHRGASPPPFLERGRSPPPYRGASPPPFFERGRKRVRSGSRSLSRGQEGRRRAARSTSPDALLAPVLVDQSLQRGGQQEWLLTGREVFIGGLSDSRDDAALWHQLMPLVAAAGSTVTERRVSGGGTFGLLVYLTLATAQQAAAVIECLQGVEVPSGQLFLRPVQKEVDAKCRQHPEAAAAARRALAAAAGHGDSRGPSRASSPGRRRHSPPRGGSPGGSRRGRDWQEPPPRRRGSPERAGHYGSRGGGGGSSGDGGSAFWDPAHQLEERCLSLLQRRGPMSLSMLFGELGAVPPPCGPLNTALLRRFLDSRPHLFCIIREHVEAAECAPAVLRYKQDLLQYLANRPPHARVVPQQLDEDMPPPPGLPRHLAAEGALHFVREVLWREAALVSLPWDRSAVAVELRPFPLEGEDFLAARMAGHDPPIFNQPCRFFFQLNGTRALCSHGLGCRFGHAPPREDFI